MTTSEFFGKFLSKYLWGNLIAMICAIVLVALGMGYGLNIYTHHGEAIEIPNIVHKNYADAGQALHNLGLRIEVTDTGYVKTLPANYILEQSPAAGERVKSGHIIYVIINASHSPTITLPDVIDNCSLREAMAKLTAMGFQLDQPQFVPGERDWVYGILVNGQHVSYGDKIPVEAKLVIQVGNGMRNADDSVDFVDPIYLPDDDITGSDEADDFEEVTQPPTELLAPRGKAPAENAQKVEVAPIKTETTR